MLDGLSRMRDACKQAAVLLACVQEEEGKKRVVVQQPVKAMHNCSLEHASTLMSSISRPNHAWSYEFL